METLDDNINHLCILSFHIENDELDPNQKQYIYEVSKYFDKVICLHNSKKGFQTTQYITYIYCPSTTHFQRFYCYLHNQSFSKNKNLKRIALFDDSYFVCNELTLLDRKKHEYSLYDCMYVTETDGYCDIFCSQLGIKTLEEFFKNNTTFDWTGKLKTETFFKSQTFPQYLHYQGCPLIAKKNNFNWIPPKALLVNTCTKNILIYVLCHDNESYNIAKNELQRQIETSAKFKIVQISNTNRYFESQIFKYLNENTNEWLTTNYDYIGIITYSFWKKNNSNMSLSKYIECLNCDSNNSIDVLPLRNMRMFRKVGIKQKTCELDLYESSTISHGTSIVLAFNQICKVMLGLNTFEARELCKRSPHFMSNWWIAKPFWLKKYCEFCLNCMKYIENNPDMQEIMNTDAMYGDEKLPENKKIEIFDKPYYTHYPFLFERLPAIYFTHKKCNIKQYGLTLFNL